jgi:2'-5' RNA ligase
MKQKSKPFNIVIVPPKEISRSAIKLSRKFKGLKSLFVLNQKNKFPHLSLYMLELPLKNISKVKKILEEIAKRAKPFKMESLKYRHEKHGFLDIYYRRPAELKKFQTEIVEAINPLRRGMMRKKDLARLLDLNKNEQKNLKKYGFRSVGSEYHPHLTLTRLKRYDKTVISGLKPPKFSFEVKRIGLFYLGDNGTCRQPVKRFDLKG